MFERIPSGVTVFLDANIFVYHVLEARPSCALLLRRVRHRELRAVTSATVLSEAHHRLMVAEAVERFRLTSAREGLNLLRRHPERLALMVSARRFLTTLPALHVRVLPVRRREVLLAGALSQQHSLLTNDAVIVATMRAHRLTHLATNDEDFCRVPDLLIWRP